MIDKNKNQDTGEFDDDAFDVEELSDADFDDPALEDDAAFDDLPADDAGYEDEDFSEDWEEDADPAEKKKGKKEKSLYKTGEKKGLSFNAIVIIGAVVVGGGVMAVNIMNKTAEVKSGEKTIFQSVLGIGGIMDGMLFGNKEETPTPEQVAAQQQQTQNEGFLNNPDAVNPAPSPNSNAQAISPPQPTPIMPTDGTQAANDPLVPMPPTPPSPEAPRGPEDAPPIMPAPGPDNNVTAVTPPPAPEQSPVTPEQQQPVVTSDVAAVPPIAPPSPETATENAPRAEDILKEALANREQRASESALPAPKEEVVADTNVPVVPLEEKAPDVNTPEATTPVVTPTEPATPAATKEDVEAGKQAVASLESKLDTIIERMDRIESDLGSVKEAKGADYRQIEETVQSLKSDLAAIKDRPAPQPVRVADRPVAEETVAESTAAEEPKPAPAPVKKKAKKKTSAQTASSASVSGRWELRAAQPGRAWVSRPGERDMQTVEVGQNLPGIGRITGITYQNNRWTVLGTQGQIQQ